jgi:hypothetical protein
VPPPPYFHGTRNRLEVGDELRPGQVNPNEGSDRDDRYMVWATTDLSFATSHWAHKRGERGPVAYVYEVELDDPEPDTMVPEPHRSRSVMARSGRVIRLVSQEPARGF